VAELRAHGGAVLQHLTPSASASLIRSLAALGLAEDLLWAWQAMRLAGVEPSRLTYNCLLDGLVNAGLLDTAINVFDAMSTEDRVRPDVVSCNILIDAMARLDDMREQAELAPDKVTYLTLMQHHYSEGTFSQCVGLFQEMGERGTGKEIPQHAYVLVIGALCKEGKPFEGMAVFERMLKRDCPANAAIYTALIDSMRKFGREKEAMTLFERMKTSGIELDASHMVWLSTAYAVLGIWMRHLHASGTV
jgi:pentatricopeptide repeat protein